MAVNVAMPKWGLTMKEGKIVNWLVKEGEPVKKGQDLFEVETEKITNIVESLADGILFQIVVPAGTVVKTGTIVAVITEPGETAERIEGIQVGEAPEGEPSASKPAADKKDEKPAGKKGFVPATPAARRLAKELDIDLTLVPGSGPNGRVTENDVTRYHEEGPPPPKITPLALEMAKQAGLDITSLTGTGEGGKITQADVEKALAKEETEAEPAAGEKHSLYGHAQGRGRQHVCQSAADGPVDHLHRGGCDRHGGVQGYRAGRIQEGEHQDLLQRYHHPGRIPGPQTPPHHEFHPGGG